MIQSAVGVTRSVFDNYTAYAHYCDLAFTEMVVVRYGLSSVVFQEYFESLRRDLEQCESGYNVESIQGDQRSKAIFTLLPPEGLC